jgi:hypothetical protein
LNRVRIDRKAIDDELIVLRDAMNDVKQALGESGEARSA